MDLKKIFWSLLAGASIAVTGCNDDNKTPADTATEDPAGEDEVSRPDAVYYGPPTDVTGEATDAKDTLAEDAPMEEMVVETPDGTVAYGPPPDVSTDGDAEEEEGTPAPEYGPPRP